MSFSLGAFMTTLRQTIARSSDASQRSDRTVASASGVVSTAVDAPTSPTPLTDEGEEARPPPLAPALPVSTLPPSVRARLVQYDSDSSDSTLDRTQPLEPLPLLEAAVALTVETLINQAIESASSQSLGGDADSSLPELVSAAVKGSGLPTLLNDLPVTGARADSSGALTSSTPVALARGSGDISTESAVADETFASPERSPATTVYIIGSDLASDESIDDSDASPQVISNSVDCAEETIATSGQILDASTTSTVPLRVSPQELGATQRLAGPENLSTPVSSSGNSPSSASVDGNRMAPVFLPVADKPGGTPFRALSPDSSEDDCSASPAQALISPECERNVDAAAAGLDATSVALQADERLNQECCVVLERVTENPVHSLPGRYPSRPLAAPRLSSEVPGSSAKKVVSFRLSPVPPDAADSPRVNVIKRLRLKAALRGIRVPPATVPPRCRVVNSSISSENGAKVSDAPVTSAVAPHVSRKRGRVRSQEGATTDDGAVAAQSADKSDPANVPHVESQPSKSRSSTRPSSRRASSEPDVSRKRGRVRSQEGARTDDGAVAAQSADESDPAKVPHVESQPSKLRSSTRPPSRRASSEPASSKRRGSRRASSRSSPPSPPSDEDSEMTIDEEASESPRTKSPPSKRPKGDQETRLRTECLRNAKRIFASASRTQTKSAGRPKAIPVADVPPRIQADRDRVPATSAELTLRTTAFIDQPSAQIDLGTLQHTERLHIVRLLIMRAYGDEHDVAPLLRLLEQNGRANNDPLPAIAAALDPNLIDTRLRTQTSSAHLVLFNYIVPLFMQRWAIMAAGTTGREQWRSLGLTYNNWNGYVRWAECVLVAPAETVTLAQKVLEKTALVHFQKRLGAAFVKNEDMLRRWVHIRRCSVAVADDKAGASLFADLIVSSSALWLALTEEDEALIDAAYGEANRTALKSTVSERVVYPAPSVYHAAIVMLTELLGSAVAGVSHSRRIERSLVHAAGHPPAQTWIRYEGGDGVIAAGIAQLQGRPPLSISATRASTDAAAEVTLTCCWPAEGTALHEVLNVQVPLVSANIIPTHSVSVPAEIAPLETAPREETRHNEESTCLCITGLRATFDLARLINMLMEFGAVSAVYLERLRGRVHVVYDDERSADSAVTCFYASIPRHHKQHSVSQSLPNPLPQDAELLVLAPSGGAVVTVGGAGGGGVPSADLDGTLFQIGTFGPSLQVEPVSPDLLDEVRAYVQAASAYAADMQTSKLTSATLNHLILTADKVHFDILTARKSCEKWATTRGAATTTSFLAALRVLTVHHLFTHPQDRVFVTPMGWFDVRADMNAAARPEALFLNGTASNPADCRLLMIPLQVDKEVMLIVVAFPWSFQCVQSALFAPCVTVYGPALDPKLLARILLMLFIRLEALLSEGCPLRRGTLTVIETEPAAVKQHHQALLQLLLAARLSLQMHTSLSGPPVRKDAFSDATLLQDTQAFIRALSTGGGATVAQQFGIRNSSLWNQRLADIGAADATRKGVLYWDHSALTAVYERYLAISCMRRNERQDWISEAAVDGFVTTETITRFYVYVNEALRRRGGVFKRALYTRLQQLHGRGFQVVACHQQLIEVRRGFGENCWLKLPSFGLYSPSGLYSDADEIKRLPEGWHSCPVWISHRDE